MKPRALFLALTVMAMSASVVAQSGPYRPYRISNPKGEAKGGNNVGVARNGSYNEFGNAEQLRRKRIIDELNKLSATKADLLAIARGDSEENNKEVASLAEKIAKSAHRLREEYTKGESDEKITPAAYQGTARSELAEMLAKLVDKTFKSRPDSKTTFSAEKFNAWIDHLKTLEGYALALRALTKN